jgi:predicted permease
VTIAELLVPDFALIALGFLLRRYGGFSDEFWNHLERFVYFVLFPALLFGALARGRVELVAASGLPLPTIAGNSLHFLGEAALPVGLIAVGAGLMLKALTQRKRMLVYLVAVKLLAVPAVAYFTARALGLQGVYFDAALVLAALPTASSAYILATRMGGDGRVVASLITLDTLVAIVTLPFWLSLRSG